MNLFADITSVLVERWQLILSVLVLMLLGQMLVGFILKLLFGQLLSAQDYYSLSAAGWMLPLLFVSLSFLVPGVVPPPAYIVPIVLICIVLLAFVLRARKERLTDAGTVLFSLIAFFGIFFFLRLAFVSKTPIPSYFDSAQHYQIIKNLVRDLGSHQTTLLHWPGGGYYHIGFHLVAAWITSLARAEIIPVMLILGHMILVTIPLSVFFLVREETRSSLAGLFAVLLAAVGWYMPAYAVNWGKYPAVASLPLILFLMSLMYLSARYKQVLPLKKYLALNAFLVFAICLTGLVHSRSLVIVGIFAFAWVAAAVWQRFSMPGRWIVFCFIAGGIILEIGFIQTKDVFGPLFDPYWDQGVFVTSIVLIAAVFALWAYPRLAFTSILAVLLLLGSLFLPVTVPGYGTLTLLDRPFVEMILYLPLSLLGGAGLAGLERSIERIRSRVGMLKGVPTQTLSLLVIGLVAIHAGLNYSVYPSDCCNIVGRDDLMAIDWMEENLPTDARILISSTELRVLATDSFQGTASGDAGAWITPLTDRVTFFLPYSSDFNQRSTLETICQLGADYIYVGEMGTRFNREQIDPNTNWYKMTLSMPEAKVYQVIGCEARE